MRSTTAPSRSLRALPRALLLAAGLAAVSVAGCGGAEQAPTDSAAETTTPTTPTTPTTSAAQAVSAAEQPEVASAPVDQSAPLEREAEARHARGPFAALEGLDLRDDQRAKIAGIQKQLEARLEPARGEGRALAVLLAAGIEGGKIDEAAVLERRTSLEASAEEARRAFGDAANAVHATLDADQRTELVLTLRASRAEQRFPRETASDEAGKAGETGPAGQADGAGQAGPAERADRAGEPGRGHRHGMGKLAAELGLSAEQTRSLREGARAIFEGAFPSRKAHREHMEAQVKAAEEAFMSDTFDAHQYDFGAEAAPWIQTAARGASKLSGLAASVLTEGQRAALAGKIREGAAAR
jgi:hypothetical protein